MQNADVADARRMGRAAASDAIAPALLAFSSGGRATTRRDSRACRRRARASSASSAFGSTSRSVCVQGRPRARRCAPPQCALRAAAALRAARRPRWAAFPCSVLAQLQPKCARFSFAVAAPVSREYWQTLVVQTTQLRSAAAAREQKNVCFALRSFSQIGVQLDESIV